MEDGETLLATSQFPDLAVGRAWFEQELPDGYLWLRTVVDAIPGPVSYVDADCRCRFGNLAYHEWFGGTADDSYGRPLSEVMGEHAWASIRVLAMRALAGERVTFEGAMARGSETRYVRADYVPYRCAGVVRGFFAIMTDLTDMAESIGDALIQMERGLDCMLAEVNSIRMISADRTPGETSGWRKFFGK